MRLYFQNFSFKAGKEIVKAKYKIKILGIWVQDDLKNGLRNK